ncbi:MAG TPA: biotin/lipoyl-binding protein, partial [Candidatus Nitrosotenuis sp.]|nr:biotin/lipoyl-binding protein [Candidatus Nitrosotenuis sp.]
MRTRAMVVLAAVLLLAGTLAIWRQTTRLPLVSLETPRRGELEARFVASGRVQARTIHIESPRGGLLRSVPVEENQAVRRGQVLATFEDSELRARVEGARAALESAQRRRDELLRRRALAEAQGEADVEAARAEYQQIRWQYEEVRRGASPDALRKAEAALKEAQARLEAARAARQRAEELFAQDIISREELEKARTEEEVARARRDQA